jgi:Family of unknown function (DUF6515)
LKSTKILLLIGLMILFKIPDSFCGVGQERAVNSNRTNIGTNPYKDMEAGYDNQYVYVNPNYSENAALYPEEYGSAAVDPLQATAGQNGMAIYNGHDALVAEGYYPTTYISATIPMGTIVESIPSSAVPTRVRNTTYYYDSSYNLFFMQVFDAGAIIYQVIPPPLGAVVTTLPAGCLFQYMNGKPVSICGSTYYQQVAGGYEVIAR